MEDGVWRTIRGRRVFIKDGESPIDAFKNNINSSKKLINDDGTINEEVALKGANPKKGRMNCQRCVPTYNERLKGNDVTAKLSSEDINPNQKEDDFFAKNWDTIYEGIKDYRDWNRIFGGSGVKEIEYYLKQLGDKAVVQISFAYNRKSGAYGDGHTIIARNSGGKIKWEDPQNGRTDCRKWFIDNSLWGRTDYLRIDDKKVKAIYEDKIYEKGSGK